MTIDIRNQKFSLIELIMSVDDSRLLEEMAKEVRRIKNEGKWSISLEDAVKSIRSNVTIEDIDSEQPYTPLSIEEFRLLADEVGLEEPIDELLNAL